MVAIALRCEELKESLQLVDMCATFQATSADCEGSFSLMNHSKTASRNCLEGAHEVKARCRQVIQPGQNIKPLEK